MMSLERVINALVGLGLTRLDAEVYVYLAKNGPLSEIVLARELTIKDSKLNRSLKNLRNKEIVRTVGRTSIELWAIPFEEALNLLIEINKQQNVVLQEVKRELFASWKNISKKTSENN